MSSIFNVYVVLRFRCALLVCIRHVVFFDTLRVFLFPLLFFKFLVFEAAIYAAERKVAQSAAADTRRLYIAEDNAAAVASLTAAVCRH